MSDLNANDRAHAVQKMRADMNKIGSLRRRAEELDSLLDRYSSGLLESTEVTRGGGIRSWFSRRGISTPASIELSKQEQDHLRAWIAAKSEEYRASASKIEEKVALGGH